jgi:hypothetical protein
MNVGQLRTLLANAPDDAVILVPASDHSYREVRAVLTTALGSKRDGYMEDFGEEFNESNAPRVQAVVVGG